MLRNGRVCDSFLNNLLGCFDCYSVTKYNYLWIYITLLLSNKGNFGRKEKSGWRAHGRNGTENINHRGGYHGGNSRSRSSIFHSGKSQGLHENNIPDNETGRKEDKRERRQFEAEDFVSFS